MSGEKLDWYYESPGHWVAQSKKLADYDLVAYYRITVQKSGLFTLSESDRILDAGSRLYETLRKAKGAAALIESYGDK